MLQVFENHSCIPLQNAAIVIPSGARDLLFAEVFPYLFTSLLLYFAFLQETINSITETITHIQANQSPSRV